MENMANEEVCYTREVALEKAIEMEMKSFQTYKKAYLKIQEPHVKDLVKDLALEELEHKYILEKALLQMRSSLQNSSRCRLNITKMVIKTNKQEIHTG